MKPAALALIVVCDAMLLGTPPAFSASPVTLAGAEPDPVAEDAPVAGGVAALAAAAEVAPVPDRARFVAELARIIYSSPGSGPYSNEPARRRIAAALADARKQPGATGAASPTEVVPIPLSAKLWSQILGRSIDRGDLVGAILTDRTAALLCYSLAGMDDQTLQFFAGHPSVLSRLGERAAASFAAFGESLHIQDGRVVPPGGDAAAALWEAVVGERVNRPERFVQLLFESHRGRVAYLYDVLSHVDPPRLAFALGSSTGAQEERVNRFKRLAAVARRAFVEWDVTTAPFVRPPNAFGALFSRVRVEASGALAGGAQPAFWQRAFDESVSSGPTAPAADAAWLAELIVGQSARERERRLETFSFAQRVFGSVPAAGMDDALEAVRAFPSCPVLMLTLERMGMTTPSTYAAGARQAEHLTSLDAGRGSSALSQFQGALALLDRMVRARTITAATAEPLARDLFAVRVNDAGRYGGGIAAWMSDRLLPTLGAGKGIDDVLLGAVTGPRATGAATSVEWEGQRYHVDVGGAERQRLDRVRNRLESATFATVLGLAALARDLARPGATLETARNGADRLTAVVAELGSRTRETARDKDTLAAIRETLQALTAIRRPSDLPDARRAGAELETVADAMLGEALLSLSYAINLGDPDGTILIAGDPSRRHDFGYGLPGRDARVKAMWGVALTETRSGPSHLVGSALALDVAMAPLALRRITTDRVPESPMLNLMQRDSFAATVSVMDPRALLDKDRDEIAARIERGRARVDALGSNPGANDTIDALARDAGLDGWRARALRWTARHEPGRVARLFSMTELLVLGGGSPSAFSTWGTYAMKTAGCLCTELAPPGRWQSWWGLSQAGLPAALVADLPLRVAVMLHNLQLPAVLAKPALAAAMQDFVDSVNPTDGNDWLTLAQAAQTIGRERFEDYIAAATADGPLLPDILDKQ